MDDAASDGDRDDFVEGLEGKPRDDALDDMVCDAQDAFFEGRYNDVIALAAQIHARDEAEEDTYDILLASHLALGQYSQVVAVSHKWVALCEESLKQLVYLVESAYMLGDAELVKDAAFKLAFLFESSDHDQVRRMANDVVRVVLTGALAAAGVHQWCVAGRRTGSRLWTRVSRRRCGGR